MATGYYSYIREIAHTAEKTCFITFVTSTQVQLLLPARVEPLAQMLNVKLTFMLISLIRFLKLRLAIAFWPVLLFALLLHTVALCPAFTEGSRVI